jgi:hypothetical protein
MGINSMPFSKDQSANLAGRAPGARNQATLALEAMFDAQAEALVHGIIDRAVGGHPAAMRLCLARALPVGRGRPLPIRLPPVENPEDMRKAIADIDAAFAAGTITIREAAALLGALDGHMGHIPGIEALRKAAGVEADLAKAAAALGIDTFITISEGPRRRRRGGRGDARAGGPARQHEEHAMKFEPGQSGNPAGRPPGARNKTTLALEAAFYAEAEAVVARVIERAKGGHPAAMRLCMERALPVGRGRPLPIALPVVKTAEDAQAATAEIMAALADGAISAGETVDLLRVVEGLTRTAGSIGIVKKLARQEVARAAAQLGMDHFFAGPPSQRPYDDAAPDGPETDAGL